MTCEKQLGLGNFSIFWVFFFQEKKFAISVFVGASVRSPRKLYVLD